MVSRCYSCNERYNDDDGLQIGLFYFMCFNCLKNKLEKTPITPVKKKRWVLFLIPLLAIPFVHADDINNTIDSNITLDYNQTIDIAYVLNTTMYNHYVFCNDTTRFMYINTTIVNNNMCNYTADLGFGQTFVRQDNSCNLRFTCPTKPDYTGDIENVSYSIPWQISSDGTNVSITYVSTGYMRTYPFGNVFNFTDNYRIYCPQLRNNTCSNDQVFTPINISEDQWYWYCLQPFGQYGATVRDFASTTSAFQEKLVQKITDLTASNTALSEENGKLKQQQQQWQTDTDNFNNQKALYAICQTDKSNLDLQYSKLQNSKSNRDIVFYSLTIIELVIGIVVGGWIGFRKISGMDKMKEG